MKATEFKSNYNLNITIITLSDRASRGEYEDISGKLLEKELNNFFLWNQWNYNINKILIPDSADLLNTNLKIILDAKTDILVTTGGTGISDRDITIETIKPYLSKELPGVMEHIRMKYATKNPNVLLSRSIAGVIKNTLVFCLPGSAKAVKDYVTEILCLIEHAIFMLHNIEAH